MNYFKNIFTQTALLFVFASAYANVEATLPTEPSSNIKFYVGSFNSAKVKAQGEGKLFFVDFYANWCTPCKWMEESTFKDNKVVELMEESYVPYKVDIDKPEGYELKKKFGVRILPTFLIFNKDGELVERVEETLDAQKLRNLLEFHAGNNSKVIVRPPNVKPSGQNKTVEDEQELAELYKNYKEKLSRETKTFNAQIGMFPDYREAYSYVNAIRKQFLEPILVIADYRDGVTFYKVLLGQFQTIEEANSFCKILIRDHEIQAIVH